jgi:ribonuclease HII
MGKQLTWLGDPKPDFREERALGGRIAGLDEAGRGPLAGPVVAAAVVLEADNFPAGLDDSKKLSVKERERLFASLQGAAAIGVGQASVEEIDKLNILEAAMLAMRRALSALPFVPDGCLVDGRTDPRLGVPSRLLVKGDCRSLSVAAASVIAKVTRDRIMTELAKDFPAYGWEQNAGYCVPHHLRALELVGPSPHHRRSFLPVREALGVAGH